MNKLSMNRNHAANCVTKIVCLNLIQIINILINAGRVL